MRIGVIADTHLTKEKIPEKVLDLFTDVDAIIHCGDFVNDTVAEVLENLGKPFYAVFGNMDEDMIRKKYPRRQVLEFEGIKIGLFHGRGAPDEVRESVEMAFVDECVDAYVFGHSHEALNIEKDGKLFFNPGSATDKRRAPYCSFGILTVADGEIHGEIIPLDKT